MMRHTTVYGVLIVSFGIVGCGGGKTTAGVGEPLPALAHVEVPAWVDRVPEVKGKLCALGSAEPTFYREDGKIYAAENARTQLAHTISIRVESVMVDIQSTSGSDTVEQQYVTQAQSFATDAVVSGAQVISYWYDDLGARGRQRATYAFACLDTSMSVAELNNRLQEAFPEDKARNQKVRERAKAMFDDLEKEEDKQQAKNAN